VAFPTGWSYYKVITLDHTLVSSGPLIDFVKIIRLTSDANIPGHCQADGDDIRFSDDSGSPTAYPFGHIGTFNSSDIIEAVKVPSISAVVDTPLRIWYGNGSATDDQNKTGAVDSAMVAFVPCQDTPSGGVTSGDIEDWCGNDLSSNAYLDSSNQVSGLIGNALYFDNDGFNIAKATFPSIASNFSTEASYSMLVKKDTNAYNINPDSGGWSGLSIAGGNANHYRYADSIYDGTFVPASGRQGPITSLSGLDTSVWHHVCITAKPGTNNWIYYQNGTSVHAGSGNTAITIDNPACLTSFQNGYYLGGKVQHARLANVARSAAWVAYEASDLSSNSSTYTSVGSEQSAGGSNVTVTPPVASLTLTKFAPQLKLTATPPAQSLVTTKFAPRLALSVSPPTKSLSLTTFAPTASASAAGTFTPPTKALTISAFAPTVSNPRTVTPPTKSLAISAFAPTVSTPRTITPPLATLTIASFGPQLKTAVIPATKALTTSRFAPVIYAPKTIVPGVLSLTTTRFAPVVTNGTGVEVHEPLCFDLVFEIPQFAIRDDSSLCDIYGREC